MHPKVMKLELYQCQVCGRRFKSEAEATPEFDPPDPFPVGTKVRMKVGSDEVGGVTTCWVSTDDEHAKHRRVIGVSFARHTQYFYIYADRDDSTQLERVS